MFSTIRHEIYLIAIACVFGLGILGGGLKHQCVARADAPPAPPVSAGPSSRPSADEAVASFEDQLSDLSDALGDLTDDEKTKLAAMEKSFDEQLKADPSKLVDADFHEAVNSGVRNILTPEHQKKFDAMLAQSRKRAIQIKTSSSLRLIGNYSIAYRQANGKNAPDLASLLSVGTSPEVFLCADSKTTVPADWKSLDAASQAKWVNKNSDFIYLAGNQPSNVEPNFVVAYIKPELSPEGNIFLLFDGSVYNESAADAKPIIDDLKTGKNPSASLKESLP
jgi:hypothetical protein